jgi:polyisoprenoid-binding protein YceI
VDAGGARPSSSERAKVESWIKFDVKASMKIAGNFDKWDATLKFTSPDETTGVLEIITQATSGDTGSGMKNGKLKSKDFFDVENNPVITFKSTKIVKTGHETYEVDGDFTIRGVSNPEKLTLTVSGKGTGSGEIKGKMVFNRGIVSVFDGQGQERGILMATDFQGGDLSLNFQRFFTHAFAAR